MIVLTEDGSPTILSPHYGEYYHSIHGACRESEHVFVHTGLLHRLESFDPSGTLYLFEVGFGTALNALLTLREQRCRGLSIHYSAIEKFPLERDVYEHLRFSVGMADEDKLLQSLHHASWGMDCEICPGFTLHKIASDLTDFTFRKPIDLIYFDAFSPEAQPELWSEEIFTRMVAACRSGAVLATYCAKGEIRRRLTRAGFHMERLPGPPGKREILRATYYLEDGGDSL